MREIVAAQIGTMITNNPGTIAAALEKDAPIRFLDRLHMQIMASFDLGARWEKLASGPTLFLIGEDGQPKAAIRTDYALAEKK